MKIDFNPEWYKHALEEQKMRAPYMMTKYANTEARKAGQLRGLVIEHHVSGWFKKYYPLHYLEPDNYRQWRKICSHDFKIKTSSKILYLDVSGPKKDGTFGSYSYKPQLGVDFHILCNAIGFKTWNDVDYKKGFEIPGVVTPENYKKTINMKDIINFGRWLKQIGL
ncbi:MAG: hypothetical protein ACLFVR_15070 [Thiohalospira sp.]